MVDLDIPLPGAANPFNCFVIFGQWLLRSTLTLETQMSLINSQFCKMTKATDHLSLRTCFYKTSYTTNIRMYIIHLSCWAG